MPQVINTNISSLNAQRNLNASQGSLAISLQRLSSGLRINSAKDDAAGLGISERMSTQVRGLNQATRNANDGISLAQTGEGALAEIGQNLQRIRELAVQSANATNSASDRSALDAEVQQRIAEINRVAVQSSFNGQKILDGTFGSASFQVGANVGETIGLSLNTSMKTADIGKVAVGTSDYASANPAVTPTVAGAGGINASTITADLEDYTGVDLNPIDTGSNKVTINGVDVAPSATYAIAGGAGARAGDSAYAKAAAINASGINGVTATASTSKQITQVGAGLMVNSPSLATGDTMGYGLTLNGIKVIDETTSGLMTATKRTITIPEAVAYINERQSETGVQASAAANGDLVLTAADGRNITIQENWSFADGGTAVSDSTGTSTSVFGTAGIDDDATASNDSDTLVQAAVTIARGQLTLSSSADITISAGATVVGFGTAVITATGNLEGQNVKTPAGANAAIRAIDSALISVTDLRAMFGSIQNRFESVIANLSATAENLTASRSRILDADFAVETANLTRSQILQQAGVAMLAQANALPNQVLQLLQR